MNDDVLETIRATVQDLLAPELKTHGVQLTNLEQRINDTRHSIEQRSDDLKNSLEHRTDDSKELLRAEFRALEAKVDSRISALENLIRALAQQVSFESGLRERVASLEARMPKQ